MEDLEKVERCQFEDVDYPRKCSLGAVGEQDHLQTTGHQGAVEDVLFQQNLPKKTPHKTILNRQKQTSELIYIFAFSMSIFFLSFCCYCAASWHVGRFVVLKVTKSEMTNRKTQSKNIFTIQCHRFDDTDVESDTRLHECE